jgi:hypothetical protein
VDRKVLMSNKTLYMSLAGSQYVSFRISIVVTLSIMLPCSLGLITFRRKERIQIHGKVQLELNILQKVSEVMMCH